MLLLVHSPKPVSLCAYQAQVAFFSTTFTDQAPVTIYYDLPAKEDCMYSGDSSQLFELSVMHYTGNVVATEAIDDISWDRDQDLLIIDLDASTWPTGLYFAKFRMGRRGFVGRGIKVE